MERVTGIGGIFFKAEDPEKLKKWYSDHLGVAPNDHGTVAFEWRDLDEPKRVGFTLWAPFKRDTTYFDPSSKPFMVNFRVADLDALTYTMGRGTAAQRLLVGYARNLGGQLLRSNQCSSLDGLKTRL